ncbi:hypothetical protein KFE25_011729 [Diacronema lutheri]|uniref:Hexosyltransferase n=1 Tax=Diacronema lutheri TaxID=2081491 RepID=A0A8J6C866_DIALT|nr:hypothetical protein KFE25_011729 [Diacronema lutheri]
MSGTALLAACVVARIAQFREPTSVVLAPSHECWPSVYPGAPAYDLVVVIAVGANALRREALRESWAAPHAAGTACSVMHLLAHAAPGPRVYHRRTGDEVLLFLNTTDTYERLPVKVIGSLQWLSAHVRYKYVLKTDDDAWICTHALLETFGAFPRERLYWGKMNTRHALIANVTHHGSVHSAFTRAFDGATRYSTYAFGAAYALSADVAATISDASALGVAEHVHIEDVLVGELISRRLGSSVRVRDARRSAISLGYTRQQDSASTRSRATHWHLRRLCTAAADGGKGSMIVHRIFPQQVRTCAAMAARRCACDGRVGRCDGRPANVSQAVSGLG